MEVENYGNGHVWPNTIADFVSNLSDGPLDTDDPVQPPELEEHKDGSQYLHPKDVSRFPFIVKQMDKERILKSRADNTRARTRRVSSWSPDTYKDG